MYRIDLENHFYDESFIKEYKSRTTPPFLSKDEQTIQWSDAISMPQGQLLTQLRDIGEARMERMRANGITGAVISSASGPEQLDTPESIDVCSKTNETVYELTRDYPDFYYGSAILPVSDIEESLDELKRCVKDYGFVAWHTHSNYGETDPSDRRYYPLFQEAADLGIYVYLHPNLPDSRRLEGYGFTFAGPGMGFTVDTMITLTRMIISGLFDEIPDLKVVIGHLGEALPFLMDRIDNRLHFLPNAEIRMKQDFRYYFKNNIMVTTSGNMSRSAFECTKNVLGMDRICFASDYPFENAEDMTRFVNGLDLSREEQELLFYRNAVEKLNVNTGVLALS